MPNVWSDGFDYYSGSQWDTSQIPSDEIRLVTGYRQVGRSLLQEYCERDIAFQEYMSRWLSSREMSNEEPKEAPEFKGNVDVVELQLGWKLINGRLVKGNDYVPE